MKLILLVFTVLISAAYAPTAPPVTKKTCKLNEVWVSCSNPCPRTCEMLVSEGPEIQCMPPFPCPGGCDCIQDYVRDKNNKCVRPTQCKCPDPNAEVVSCPSPCPLTCKNYKTPPPCTAMCVKYGCACKKGYVLNNAGKCILKSACPKY